MMDEARNARSVETGSTVDRLRKVVAEIKPLFAHGQLMTWKKELAAIAAELSAQPPAAQGVRIAVDDDGNVYADKYIGLVPAGENMPLSFRVEGASIRYNCTKCLCNGLVNVAQPPAAGMVPTEAMLIAARDWSQKKYGKPIGDDAAIGCWNAMSAAAPAAQEAPAGQKPVTPASRS